MDTTPPKPLPIDASEEQVMERWRWFNERAYSTVFGRELHDSYQRFFYDHEAVMFRMAARGQGSQ